MADPYLRCEEGGCTHELARGVLLEELLGGDGPYPLTNPLLSAPRSMAETIERIQRGN